MYLILIANKTNKQKLGAEISPLGIDCEQNILQTVSSFKNLSPEFSITKINIAAVRTIIMLFRIVYINYFFLFHAKNRNGEHRTKAVGKCAYHATPSTSYN
jgi:hypothetical protein